MPKYSLGLDFGTESVRAIVVDIRGGRVGGQGLAEYRHGVIDRTLPTIRAGSNLPADYALQHPQDWIDSMGIATTQALAGAGVAAEDVVGIGVDFTSCTMLP